MSLIRGITILMVVCTAACFHIGPEASKFPLAALPNGVTVAVETSGQSAQGELLAVRDDGIVILHGPRLSLVPYADLRSARVVELPDHSIGAGAPSPVEKARLNVVSRYPQGIGPALQQKLLAQSGQTELEVLR